MTNILLIVVGWDIAVDNDYVNSFDSKINGVKNKIGLSNDDNDDNSYESNYNFVEKSNTRDNNLNLRLKGLSKRQVGKGWFHRGCIIYFHLHYQLRNDDRIKTCKVYRSPLSTVGT